jgi:hypothetical protein
LIKPVTPEHAGEQTQQDLQAEIEKILALKGQIVWEGDLDQVRQDRVIAQDTPAEGIP